MSPVLKRWMCCICRDSHATQQRALTCCLPPIAEVFSCTLCDTEHGTEADAAACCASLLDSPLSHGTTPLELEAMGQQRLF